LKLNRLFKFTYVLFICTGIHFSARAVDVKKPVFSHKRGFYEKAFNLTLKAEPANAIIKYTLDGSLPSRKIGSIYSAPINISKTTIIRAMSYIDNGDSSEVRTHTLIFPKDVINQKNNMFADYGHEYISDYNLSEGAVFWTEEFDMTDVGSITTDDIKKCLVDIPSISLVSEQNNFFSADGIHWGSELAKDKAVPGSIEMIYPKGYKRGRYNSWQENCGLKIQGGTARDSKGHRDPKQSFSVLFKARYGAKNLNNDIFSDAPFNSETACGKYDRIILRAGHNDGWCMRWDREHTTFTRDEMARTLQLLMSGWGSHGTFVHLYLNGKYWGLYNPCERADDNMLANYFGGAENDYFFGKAKEGNIKGSSLKYDQFIKGDWSKSSLATLEKIVDIDIFADIIVLFAYCNPGDAQQYYFGNNTKLDKPLIFTVWDLEASFGGGALRTGDPALNAVKGIRNIDGILPNPEFKLKIADRAYKHARNNGVLVDENASAIWDSLCRVVEKPVICELARWGDEVGSLPDWKAARDSVHWDFEGRADKFINVLKTGKLYPEVDAPLFLSNSSELKVSSLKVAAGFSLTMKTMGGVIYYTLDGSDPRKSDGSSGVASTAVEYKNSPLAIETTTLLKARALAGGIWSPIHEIAIILQDDFIDLKINEIHYHPSDDGNVDGDNFEFIELKNTGTKRLNMTGVSFDMGIYYTFKSGVILDPGKFIVLASNSESFSKRYKFLPFADYKGQLKNSGETVRLVDAAGDQIDSVTYSDKNPWPVEADGGGYSLVPVKVNRKEDPNKVSTWTKSSVKNGTPGEDDPKSIITLSETIPYKNKIHTVCRVGRFRFLIPFKRDYQVSILNLQGRVITQFAKKGKLHYQWTPESKGLFFIRFRSTLGKQVIKKVLIVN
jgi:hypothetical protein